MIPISASSISDKGVSDCAARWDRTLCHRRGAVHGAGIKLPNAMEMKGRRLVAQLVVGYNSYAFANIAFNGRQWPLAIDADHGTSESVWSCVDPGNVPVVVLVCQRDRADAQHKKEKL